MSVKPRAAPQSAAVVLIPARLHSSRLPGKPMAPINGEPMIVHVWRRALEADVGPVVVACADAEIRDAIARRGGTALLTPPELPSGTDRIYEALGRIDPERRFGCVVNLQGDLPTLAPAAIRAVARTLDDLGTDIATLAVATDEPREREDPNVVKAVLAIEPDRSRLARALYFTRACAPSGDGPVWHHIGIYAYRRAALERFAQLPPSPLERRERLEQLRALEAGMTIGVALVDTAPLGVDTPADLERARRIVVSDATTVFRERR